jgi:hypothetical protein
MMRASEIGLILGASALFFFMEAQNRPDFQEWELKRSGETGKAHLSFEIRRTRPGNRSHWTTGHDVPWSTLRGIGADNLDQLSGSVKFDVVRHAGTLHCVGKTTFGGSVRARGTFTFEPDPAYSKKLTELGYFPPSDDELFTMMMNNVTLDFARLAVEAGLRSSTRDLIDMGNHGVNARYIEEVRASGFPDVSARDLIEFRNHGVNADFLRDLRDSGYNFSPRDAIELRNHGVNGDFVAELRAAGYKNMRAEEIRDLRNHGVGSEDLRSFKSDGLAPTPREMIELKNHGVRSSFLKTLRDAGHGDLPVSDIVKLHNQGVSGDFVRDVTDLGYKFTVDELIELRNHGVNTDYLRKLKASGYQHLAADKIVKLRDHGIE